MTTAPEILAAALHLIVEQSRLANWNAASPRLAAVDEGFFNNLVHETEFGRLVSWIHFAVGAEYLIKAACLARGAAPMKVNREGYPDMDVLGPYYEQRKQREGSPYIGGLLSSLHRDYEVEDALTWCKDLTQRVRNRDLHLLVKGVREGDFWKLADYYVPLLNCMLATLPETGEEESVLGSRWQIGRSLLAGNDRGRLIQDP